MSKTARKKTPQKKAAKKKAARKKSTSKAVLEAARKKERDERRRKKLDLFLEFLREGHSIGPACRMASISRRTVYAIRETDEDFSEAWSDAYAEGTESLEDKARERAVEKSDLLLMFLLKSRDARFRGEATPAANTPLRKVEFEVVDGSDPNRER